MRTLYNVTSQYIASLRSLFIDLVTSPESWESLWPESLTVNGLLKPRINHKI